MASRLTGMTVLVLLTLASSGCASFYPVETTPEGITRNVGPGDTVRVTTRELGEVRLLVTAISDYELRGRIEGDPDDVVWLRFDRIDLLEIQRLNMRKALLGVVLPVVIGAIVICNNSDCRTDGVIDARL
ncbi:MAG: hypothetical protein JXB36_07845 [Gammaproteobacteria bacterium]|nr:hypothetical protein [Gammaproteobacteria bacterium]